MVQPTGGYYYLYNGHGDTAWLLDEGGNKVEDYRYDAFGNQTTEESTLYNPFRYNGQYTDEETGLIYLRNRYYDPSIGRFITEDPVRDGLNWYVYCGNNPIAFVDPSGLAPGDLYLTMDDVAKDFLLYLLDVIGWRGEYEYGAAIYETEIEGVKYYSYNPPVTDYKSDEVFIPKEVPVGTDYVGYTHSHPDNVVKSKFSDKDVRLLRIGDWGYSVTPGGDVFKMHKIGSNKLEMYEKENGKLEYRFEVSTNMPANEDSVRLKRKLEEKGLSIEEYNVLAENERNMLEQSKKNAKGVQSLQSTLIWDLIRKKYPTATAEEIYMARQNHPESWLEVLNELEN